MGLVYGSYAPTSAHVFIEDPQFTELWRGPARYYIFAREDQLAHLQALVGKDELFTVKGSGGRFLITNQPIAER